ARLGRVLFARRPREHGEDVGDGAVRDPELLPAERPTVFGRRRERPDAGRVAARAGLGEREGGDLRSRGERWKEPLLLIVRSVAQERVQPERLVGREHDRDGRIVAGDLLEDPRMRGERKTEPAEGSRYAEPEGAELAEPFQDRFGDFAG